MIIKAPIDLELTQNSGQTSQPPWKLDNNIYSDVVVADNKAVLFQVNKKKIIWILISLGIFLIMKLPRK